MAALPGNPATWLRQVEAAELSVPGSAVSGRAAAVVHGLGELRPGGVEVTVGRGGPRSSRLARVRHREGIPTTEVAGVRVVTVEQALWDLAASVGPRHLERALDDALVRGSADIAALAAFHDAVRGRRVKGTGAMADLLAERASGPVPPGNALEAALYRVLDDPRLPAVARQAPLPWRRAAPQRVDALIPTWRRIVEADGRRWHARHADFERDRRRDLDAQSHGYEVTRLTYDHLVSRPGEALAVLLAIGAQRSPAAARPTSCARR